ncbi:putative membrane protein [Escherichia coli 3-073-06_S1_C2]|nr:putative membrane protein [Escherichia coli 3-073-06_S1_C2]
MGIASQCVDAGFILFWSASMVQYLLLWVAKQHLRAFG